jgi:hypothetical protein
MIAHLFLKRLYGCRAVKEILWLFTLSQCLGVDRGTETTTVMNISVEFNR